LRKSFLDFARPQISEEDIAEVLDTLRSGWITSGPKARRFEAEFGAFVEAPAALALNSCTAGLHAALVTAGIGPGDEVVTTPMTFAATVNVIEQCGATPVLVDVEPDTLNIDPAAVSAALTNRTKAIIAVHYAGHPAELDALREIAGWRDLLLLEDAAHALPARYKGQLIGSTDNPASFSFYATKNLTTGEGGMLTASPEFVARARIFCSQGVDRTAWGREELGRRWQYSVTMPGLKYGMTDIQASLGLGQIRRLHEMQARRKELVAYYRSLLSTLDDLEMPAERPHVEHAWHLFVLRLRGALRGKRDLFARRLWERNIGTSVHFIPIHMHPYYRDKYKLGANDFPVAYDAGQRVLSLPLYPGMSMRDATDVVEAVLDVARELCS
jgi:dTDP-4-amino-4,6-dideoxygalactose transaminase